MNASVDANAARVSARVLAWTVAIAALVRLLSLALYPIADTTESRYAEIARKMLELDDWVTPWFDYGVPFWGKPPLSIWITAASMKVFGVNEWAARLPHFLAGLLIAWIVWDWMRRHERYKALLAVALLWGSGLYFVSAGAVMTDMTLVIGTTLAMRGFWVGMHPDDAHSPRESWLLFIGLAIGLLAKGPLALVLAGPPIAIWTLLSGNLLTVWRRLPWFGGTLLMLLLAVPWYALAELKTPGFLDYFLLGEHWYRYTVPGWSGDLYGSAHIRPRGMIWLNLLLACLPWLIMLPVLASGRRHHVAPESADTDHHWRNYLWLWALTPCLFFSISRNILWTYVLPCLPPLAMLAAAWLARDRRWSRTCKLIASGLILTTAVIAAFTGFSQINGKFKSAKTVVAAIETRHVRQDQVVFVGKNQFSAAFYTRGKAQRLTTLQELGEHLHTEQTLLPTQQTQLVALSSELWKKLSPPLSENLKMEGQFESYRLYAVRH